MFWLVTVVCALLFYYFHLKVKRCGPPVFSGWLPLIGHAHLFRCDTEGMWILAKKIARESLRNGGVITFSLGPRTVYAITDPDDCEAVANKCLKKDFFYDFVKPWLGEGILTADDK